MSVVDDFEDAFEPNERAHIKWLKDFATGREKHLKNNPFGILVTHEDYSNSSEIYLRLSRKFINASVYSKFGSL